MLTVTFSTVNFNIMYSLADKIIILSLKDWWWHSSNGEVCLPGSF